MVTKSDILRVVQEKGPIIPNQLKKEIQAGDTIMLGAILSELKSAGKLRITHTKIGGSPAYYAPGTESRLQNLIKYLNEKDRRTAELLKEKKILKDTSQSPLVRVSLRNIKDFAKPLEVSIKSEKTIYWKWYMLDSKQAQEIILKEIRPEKKPADVKVQKKEASDEQARKQKPEPEKPAKKSESKAQEQKQQPKKQEKEDVQKEISLTKEELNQETDSFFRQLVSYCNENEIDVLSYDIIRKNTDIELILSVPSRIGNQEYYCKARNKKKINDGDLSSAYIQGQAKKLPVLFITTGELTKKAKQMLSKDFKGMTVKKL